jgi:periplasmic protein CpxP/Spy
MKKVIITALLVVGLSTFAQEKKQLRAEKDNLTSEQKVEAQLKKLATDLTLNENQVKAIRIIMEREAEKREAKKAEFTALREKKMEERKAMMEERKAKMQEEQAKVSAEMKKILTTDQFNKWEKTKDERQTKMKEKMSERREKKRS